MLKKLFRKAKKDPGAPGLRLWFDKEENQGSGQGKKLRIFVKGAFDLPFFMLTMLLLAVGLVMLFSASYAYAFYNRGDSLFFIKRQMIYAVLGVIGMIVMSKINYHILRVVLYVILPVTILLLLLVLVLPPTVDGFHRWIDLKIFTIQPSEIAKFALVLLFAHLISLNQDKMNTFKYGIAPYLLVLGVFCGLILLENHLSATILTFLIGIALMFIGGAPSKWFIAGAVIVGFAIAFVIIFPNQIVEFLKSGTLLKHAPGRIIAWLDKDFDPKGLRWQTNQSLYAIGSGGFLGTGIGNSRQKYLYVSEPQNDFIFSIVCEELGFVGAALILTLFVLMVWRGFIIAMRAPDRFGALVVIGLVFQVGLQTALNVAVVTDTIPNTGIGLPFFSSGGTALMMLLMQMGVVLAVSRSSSIKN